MGKHEQAILCYDKTLRLEKSDPYVWFHKGRSLEALERYREAVDAYDDALKVRPVLEIKERRDEVLRTVKENAAGDDRKK
jgi:tetratricopeptide (TPR) repeat protein